MSDTDFSNTAKNAEGGGPRFGKAVALTTQNAVVFGTSKGAFLSKTPTWTAVPITPPAMTIFQQGSAYNTKIFVGAVTAIPQYVIEQYNDPG